MADDASAFDPIEHRLIGLVLVTPLPAPSETGYRRGFASEGAAGTDGDLYICFATAVNPSHSRSRRLALQARW